jgi:hypothetical protein
VFYFITRFANHYYGHVLILYIMIYSDRN